MSWAVPLTRLLFSIAIVAVTCTACVAQQDSAISANISNRRHLLIVEDDANKAEQAECNAVKHLPKGSNECEYVKENCAKGANSLQHTLTLYNLLILHVFNNQIL